VDFYHEGHEEYDGHEDVPLQSFVIFVLFVIFVVRMGD
jgi:hypothetical protein